MSQDQLSALGIRRNRKTKRYPAPSQPTFFRLYARVDALSVERVLLDFQTQVRGAQPREELVVFDGKEPRHSGGHRLLTSIASPRQYYLGSAMVDAKTNEIPVARELFARLDLDGCVVSLDALHTQQETARALVIEHGSDYLLTVKGNQPTVRENLERLVPPPPEVFFQNRKKLAEKPQDSVKTARKARP